MCHGKPALKPFEKETEAPSGSSSLIFKCDQCNFTSSSDKGLKMHSRMKHRISQLDAHKEDSESEEECYSLPDKALDDVIDKECLNRFNEITECASFSQIFKTEK